MALSLVSSLFVEFHRRMQALENAPVEDDEAELELQMALARSRKAKVKKEEEDSSVPETVRISLRCYSQCHTTNAYNLRPFKLQRFYC